MSALERKRFIYLFFPFMFGIYPYTAVTKKQQAAMEAANVNFAYQSLYTLTYNCLIRLLGEKESIWKRYRIY